MNAATITRKFAALVLGIHARSLEAVAAAAERRETRAWNGVEATEEEIAQQEKLLSLRIADANAATHNANNVCAAVAAELDALPFINRKPTI